MTILWVFFTIVTLLGIYNFWFSKLGLSKINYKRNFSNSFAYVGEDITMIEEISNNKFLPIPLLKIESRMPKILSFKKINDLEINANMYHKSIFFMGAYRKITRTHYINCEKRGRCVLNSVSITADSLFGFSRIILEKPLSEAISIYPKTINYIDIPELSKQFLGDVIVKRWVSPDPFLVNGIRPYLNGDNLKDIHWAATARTGELKVKTYDFSASPNLLVLLNTEISEKQWGVVLEHETKSIEYGISLATTLIICAMKNGLKAGFGTNGYLCDDEDKRPVFISQDCGSNGKKNLLEVMSRLVILRSLTFFTYLETMIKKKLKDMDILIITTYINERLEGQINRLRKSGNTVNIELIKE